MPYWIIGLALSLGCVAAAPALHATPDPPIPYIFDRSEIPSECWSRGRIYAVDGHAGADRFTYEGTKERALLRLQGEAWSRGADFILRFPDLDSGFVLLDCCRGSEVRVEGEAFKCPGEWIEAEPEGESGAEFLRRKMEEAEREGLRPELTID